MVVSERERERERQRERQRQTARQTERERETLMCVSRNRDRKGDEKEGHREMR